MRLFLFMPDTRAAHPPGAAARAITVAGGLFFGASIAYFLWFYIARLETRPARLGSAAAFTLDVALFTLFAIHHSVFARAPLRAWIARLVSPYLERTVYVWIASATFTLVCAMWMPFGTVLWDVGGPGRIALRAVQLIGVGVTLWAAGALDGLALAGVRQLRHPLPASGIEHSSAALQRTGPYGLVRHPIYFGWLLIVWPAPTLTPAHLLFAALSTAYLIVATFYEEQSLHETFGPAYADYARDVRKKMIPGIY